MSSPVLRCSKLLPGLVLAFPLAALADPVTVITHTTGSADVDPLVLSQLGLDGNTQAETLPYELTLRSTFDPVATLPTRGEWAMDTDSEVVIDFRIGGMHYHYTGRGYATALLSTPYGLGGDYYHHEVRLPDAYFQQVAFGTARSFGAGGALGDREIGTFSDGYVAISTYPTNPDAPGMWLMGATPATYRLQVVSAVPEPAPYGLAAAGLLVLGWRQRMRRSRVRFA